jgi:hypothetical protein
MVALRNARIGLPGDWACHGGIFILPLCGRNSVKIPSQALSSQPGQVEEGIRPRPFVAGRKQVVEFSGRVDCLRGTHQSPIPG